jgi:hypothetical protein
MFVKSTRATLTSFSDQILKPRELTAQGTRDAKACWATMDHADIRGLVTAIHWSVAGNPRDSYVGICVMIPDIRARQPARTVVVKLALHDAGVLRKCGLFMPAGLNAVFRSVHTRMPIPRKHRRDSNRFFCISRSPPCQSALVMGGRQTIARPRVVNAVLFMPLLPPSRPESLRAQS